MIKTIEEASSRIMDYLDFPEGWHAYGDRFSMEVAVRAIAAAKLLLKCTESLNTFPGLGGEISVTGYIDKTSFIDITCEPDGTFVYSYESDYMVIDCEVDLTWEEVYKLVKERTND